MSETLPRNGMRKTRSNKNNLLQKYTKEMKHNPIVLMSVPKSFCV